MLLTILLDFIALLRPRRGFQISLHGRVGQVHPSEPDGALFRKFGVRPRSWEISPILQHKATLMSYEVRLYATEDSCG